MVRPLEVETTVHDDFSTEIPQSVREALGIEAGDVIRWSVDEDGDLDASILTQQRGAFASLQPVDLDEETDAVTDHDETAGR